MVIYQVIRIVIKIVNERNLIIGLGVISDLKDYIGIILDFRIVINIFHDVVFVIKMEAKAKIIENMNAVDYVINDPVHYYTVDFFIKI